MGALAIRDLTRTDAGAYECIASNSGGQLSAPGRLTVLFRPRVTGPEPAEVFTWVGQPAELPCTAQAEPQAEVSWTFAGRRAEEDIHMEQMQNGETSVLTVSGEGGRGGGFPGWEVPWRDLGIHTREVGACRPLFRAQINYYAPDCVSLIVLETAPWNLEIKAKSSCKSEVKRFNNHNLCI